MMVRSDADELMAALAGAAETSGCRVARVANVEDAGRYVLDVVRDLEVRSAVHSLHRVVRDALGGDLFSGTGIELTPIAADRKDASVEEKSRGRLRAVMANADLGITGVDYAIAETGTCVIVPTTGSQQAGVAASASSHSSGRTWPGAPEPGRAVYSPAQGLCGQ